MFSLAPASMLQQNTQRRARKPAFQDEKKRANDVPIPNLDRQGNNKGSFARNGEVGEGGNRQEASDGRPYVRDRTDAAGRRTRRPNPQPTSAATITSAKIGSRRAGCRFDSAAIESTSPISTDGTTLRV
jgi:hypothetical protein